METRKEFTHTTWIDLHDPSQDTLAELQRAYTAPNLNILVDQLETIPHTTRVGEFLAITLPFPVPSDKDREEDVFTILFLVSEHTLITLHTSPDIDLATLPIAEHEGDGVGLFYRLMSELYTKLFGALQDIDHTLDDIEKNIYAGQERTMVYALSAVIRDLIDIKRALWHHRDTLSVFQHESSALFPKSRHEEMHTHVIERHNRLLLLRDDHHDIAQDLRHTNDSLLNTKQNEIMKTLTVIAFLMLPLSLIAGVFGMNIARLPLADHQYGFWVVLGGMMLVTIGLILFFKYRRWF